MFMMMVAAAAQATAVPPKTRFDFQGTTLGSTPDALKALHPDATCDLDLHQRLQCHRREVLVAGWPASVDYSYEKHGQGEEHLYAIKVVVFSLGAVKPVYDGLIGKWGPVTDVDGDGIWKIAGSHILFRVLIRGASIDYVDEGGAAMVEAADRADAAKSL